ncbi:MAG: sugar ABC transporter permease, partial [Clostridia bacterium]|nr:sugar ABC transporter permease [Clostridia bacterium]
MIHAKRRHSGQEGLLPSLVTALRRGDALTRLSFLLMGSGCLFRGQVGRGLLYLAAQVLFFLYLFLFGFPYLVKFPTLGTETQHRVFDEEAGIYRVIPGDNSMEILLFGVVTVVLILLFLRLYAGNVRTAWLAQKKQSKGEPLSTFKEDIYSLMDSRYHVTLLTFPTLLVFIFTVLPLIFMVLIALTNFDKAHQPPGNLFTWVGLQNFRDLFAGGGQRSTTFFHLLGWTVVWAVAATFLNYLLGMIVALMINKRGIRAKGLWRTLFVIPIAVPQFVTLLLMSQLLSSEGTGGAFNVLLQELGLITAPINFLSDGTLAKLTVIVVN